MKMKSNTKIKTEGGGQGGGIIMEGYGKMRERKRKARKRSFVLNVLLKYKLKCKNNKLII